MFSVNFLAVIAALAAYTVLGMLWYGPLFGKKWMALAGFTEEDLKSPKAAKSRNAGYISSLVSGFAAMLTLAVAMRAMEAAGALGGALAGAGLGFGLVAMTLVSEAAWHDAPWALAALNSAYRILGLALGGLIIGVW